MEPQPLRAGMASARSDRQSHLAHTGLSALNSRSESRRPERIDQEHRQQVEQHRRRSRIVVMDTRERERAVADRLAPGRWGEQISNASAQMGCPDLLRRGASTSWRLSFPRAIDNQPTPKQEGDDRCCSRSRRELCSWQPIERRLPVPPVGVVAAGAPRWRHARDARAPDQAARSDGLCSSALPPLSRAASAP
jgi:hypothetical protein